jgi:dihydrolipoamide dehydrogenase
LIDDKKKNIEKFDLIVIGSGSGLDVANAIFQHGLKVAIIEKDRMGGTCLNRGCIPSKLLIHSADVAETIKRAHIFGIKVDSFTVDFQRMVERVNNITDSSSEGIKNAFEGIENPKLFSEECKFVGEKTLSVGEDKRDSEKIIITADRILIAAGTRPRIPKIRGLKEAGYLTSDEIFRIKKQPKTLTIIGGGYIACELAHFFGALGTEVNIFQRRELLIPEEDEEVSQRFTEIFSKKYNVYLEYEAKSVSKDICDGGPIFHITAAKKDDAAPGKTLNVVSDQLLVAAGRIPNSDTLDPHKTSVKVNDKGYIITDKYLETNVKGIFALGDIVRRYLFKHNANNEAQYAYNNIISSTEKIPVNYYAMPHAIFSSPQIAGVGLREQDLKNMGINYYKSVYPYIKTAMGEAIEDKEGFVKFLVNKTDKKILGCHIIGSDASTLIHEVLVAMRYGDGTIDSISGTIHIHPALSEVVARAAGA